MDEGERIHVDARVERFDRTLHDQRQTSFVREIRVLHGENRERRIEVEIAKLEVDSSLRNKQESSCKLAGKIGKERLALLNVP